MHELQGAARQVRSSRKIAPGYFFEERKVVRRTVSSMYNNSPGPFCGRVSTIPTMQLQCSRMKENEKEFDVLRVEGASVWTVRTAVKAHFGLKNNTSN